MVIFRDKKKKQNKQTPARDSRDINYFDRLLTVPEDTTINYIAIVSPIKSFFSVHMYHVLSMNLSDRFQILLDIGVEELIKKKKLTTLAQLFTRTA